MDLLDHTVGSYLKARIRHSNRESIGDEKPIVLLLVVAVDERHASSFFAAMTASEKR